MSLEDAEDGTTDHDAHQTRALLRRLAGADAGVVVERAVAAVDDLERAAEFVEAVGIDELEVAIARTDDEELAARGEEALGTFRRFRAAAAGELDPAAGVLDPAAGEAASTADGPDVGADGRDPTDDEDDGGHFHRGRGTDLRRDGEATSTCPG